MIFPLEKKEWNGFLGEVYLYLFDFITITFLTKFDQII